MAVNIDEYGFKAVPRGLIVTDNATGVIYVLPNPSKFALATGITELKKMAASQLGVKVTSTTVIASEEPLINLSFSTATAFITGMIMGRKFAMQSIASFLAKNNLLLTSNTRNGVVNVGEEGYGSLADVAGAKGAVFRDNQNIPLTYVQNFAGFNFAIADSFAVGANHALKFSNNLVDNPVSYQIPLPAAQRLALTADTNFDYGVKIFFLDLANRVSMFEATSVKPVLGKNFDPSAESIDVELRVNYSGASCAPYSFQYLTSNNIAVC